MSSVHRPVLSARPAIAPPHDCYRPNIGAPARAGAARAFALPSMVAGALVPAARPVLLSSNVPAFSNLCR